MWIDSDQGEQAQFDLRKAVLDLQARADENRLDGSAIILGCRRILNLWVNAGGSSLDDPIVAFLGIESQSDHVLGGSQSRVGRDVDRVRFEPGSAAEQTEVDEIGRFFRKSFIIAVRDLRLYLEAS